MRIKPGDEGVAEQFGDADEVEPPQRVTHQGRDVVGTGVVGGEDERPLAPRALRVQHNRPGGNPEGEASQQYDDLVKKVIHSNRNEISADFADLRRLNSKSAQICEICGSLS